MPMLGEVKLVPPFQPTYGNVNGQAIPVYKINFTIRGEGSYSVMVPREGLTDKAIIDAVNAEADVIIKAMDAFR